MTITRNFKLCLNAGTQNAPYINVNQYDEGEQWIFDLYTEGGQKFTPSTGAIIGIKSDGNAILNSGTVNSDGQVVITETQQMTAASGLAVFELLIEGETHGTANFIVNVERRPSDDAEFSDSDLSMLQEAIDSVTEIEDLLGGQDVPTVITPIISDWLDENITNPSNPPIDTSLTVAGAAADAKKVGDEITDLKSAIENRVSNDELLEGWKEYTPTYNHGWISGSGVYNPSDNRYISDAISTSDVIEVVNNSNVIVYVDYFSSFVDFSDFTLATYTQLNPGQSTKIDRNYPTFCVLSNATQVAGLEGILCKGASSLDYISKNQVDYLTDSIKESLLSTTISETLTTRTGNNWYYYVKIMKGMVVKVTNNNTYQGGFHANDGTNDLNLGYIVPAKSVTFIAPFDIEFFRCYQDSGAIDTTFTFDLELDNPNHYNFTDEFSGKEESVSVQHSSAGSYTHALYIPKNTLVEFTNNGDANCTVNVSDASEEINISAGVLPKTKIWFVCPLNAEQIRCYFGNGNIEFNIRFLGGNNIRLNNTSDFRDYPVSVLSSKEIDEKSAIFNQLYKSSGIVDSFLFFTDPHIKSNDMTANENFDQYIASIASFYRHVPISCVICGGDWLGNSDTSAQAVQKLADVGAICKTYLSPYYGVVGNHDTNYQGAEQISNSTIANLWYAGNNGKNYFEFDAGNTHFYALDSGLDTDADTLKAYDIEQLKWLSNKLVDNQKEYLAIVIHIIWYDNATNKTLSALAVQLSTLLQAFNGRTTYTIDGDSFNFENATGLFRFVIAGHVHKDGDTTFGNIPVILTTTTRKGCPTFDLCIADYGANKFKTVRVGIADDRNNGTFDMPH